MSVKAMVKNLSWLSVGELVSKVAMFVIVMLIARLGTEEFATFNFIISLVGILAIFTDFGSGGIFIREGTKHKEDTSTVTMHFLLLKSGFILLFFLITGITVAVLPMPATTQYYVLLYALFVAIDAITTFIYGFFRIFERFTVEAFIKIVTRLLLLGCVAYAAFIVQDISVGTVFQLYIVSGIVGLVAAGCMAYVVLKEQRKGKERLQIQWPMIKQYLLEASLLGLSTFFWQVYYRIDTVMLQFMKGDEQTAIYSAAYNIFQVVNILPALFISSIFPRYAQMYTERKHKVQPFIRKTRLILFGGGVATATAVILCAPLTPYIFGDDIYTDAIPVLRILSLSFIVLFVTHLYTNSFVIFHKTAAVTIISFIGVIFNVIANYLLIPKYGYNGSAITTLCTEALVFIVSALWIRKYIREL